MFLHSCWLGLRIVVIGLEHATIRNNVLFGSTAPFDETRYQAVLDACALRQDLDMLPAGDATGTLWWIIVGTAIDLHSYICRNWRERHNFIWRSTGTRSPGACNVLAGQGKHDFPSLWSNLLTLSVAVHIVGRPVSEWNVFLILCLRHVSADWPRSTCIQLSI